MLPDIAGVGKSTVTANLAIAGTEGEKCGVKNVRTAAYTGKAALGAAGRKGNPRGRRQSTA